MSRPLIVAEEMVSALAAICSSRTIVSIASRSLPCPPQHSTAPLQDSLIKEFRQMFRSSRNAERWSEARYHHRHGPSSSQVSEWSVSMGRSVSSMAITIRVARLWRRISARLQKRASPASTLALSVLVLSSDRPRGGGGATSEGEEKMIIFQRPQTRLALVGRVGSNV
jgi:hypothetical protein